MLAQRLVAEHPLDGFILDFFRWPIHWEHSAEVLADPEVSPHLRLEGAATVAVVPGASVERIRLALRARGMELAEHPL